MCVCACVYVRTTTNLNRRHCVNYQKFSLHPSAGCFCAVNNLAHCLWLRLEQSLSWYLQQPAWGQAHRGHSIRAQ